jgi:4-aminobutyrate aminotransferase-like enzyme
MNTAELIKRRDRLLGPGTPLFYDDPVHLVRGRGVHVWDADGRQYLDCYNNVPHVGHCHPRVVEAISKQAATLNTHTRYLSEILLDYVEQLTGLFEHDLSTATLTCTGSEANDLALRVAQAVTRKSGVIATDHTYHGNTMAVAQLSKTSPPVGGAAANVRFVPAPDSYRSMDAQAFAAAVEREIAWLEREGIGFSALLICPYFANEGFPDLDPDWLKPTIEIVRRAKGLVIADEVQPGFGRIGSHMWGHQLMRFAPDIVTLGKPMANGHPVGALVTTPDIMKTFRSSFRYFNTFGGNPVSAAAAIATLQVMQDEKLMENAKVVGAYARQGLEALAKRHAVIGNVRGRGLFFGAELVLNRADKTPAAAYTAKVASEMRRRGVLLNFIGIHRNVLKIRPPMPFSKRDADLLLTTLDGVLTEMPPT